MQLQKETPITLDLIFEEDHGSLSWRRGLRVKCIIPAGGASFCSDRVT